MSKINKNKEFISVSIGDPTKYPNLLPCKQAVQSFTNCVQSCNNNGYAPSSGLESAKEALLKKYQTPNVPNMSTKDIILTSGCSDALNIAMSSILNKNDIILLPKPGFTLYETIWSRYCFIPELYTCIAQKDWDIDLKHLESIITDCNKSNSNSTSNNPCGRVLSKYRIYQWCFKTCNKISNIPTLYQMKYMAI